MPRRVRIIEGRPGRSIFLRKWYTAESTTLLIDYERYHEVVRSLLEQILALQYNGDKAASEAFLDKWTTWKPELHEALAKKMRDSSSYRYRLVYYDALDDE